MNVRDALAFYLEQPRFQMADPGAPYRPASQAVDPKHPAHRLIVAALGARYSLVHFEREGNDPYPWLIILEKTPKGVVAPFHGVIVRTYRDPKAFDQAIRSATLWKAQR